MRNKLAHAVTAALFTLTFIGSANALQIPLLTWEQGKSQSVVLGGPTAENNWRVILKSDAGYEKDFTSSRSNSAGYRVYSLNLPNDLPVGNYRIETRAANYPNTLVAQVLIIPLAVYEAPRAPLDLLIIMLLLAVMISVTSLLRNSKFRLPSYPNYLADLQSLNSGEYIASRKRLHFNSLEMLRVKAYVLMPDTLLRSLLLLDGSCNFQGKAVRYLLLPFSSALTTLALYASQRESDSIISSLSLMLIGLVVAISIMDLFSGLLSAALYLVFSVLFFSGIGLKSVTASILVALIFVIPTLFISMGTYLEDDASRDRKFPLVISLIGVSFLPMAYLILRSFDDSESDLVGLLVLISIGLLALSWYKAVEIRTFLNSANSENSSEIIQARDVLRIISPTTIISIYLVLLSIFFIWSENLAISLIASTFWCAPLYISMIKFESNLFSNFRNWYRSTFLEIALVIAMIYGIYYLLNSLPLLVQDRSKLMLSILALPVVIHALYVASVESGKLISKANL